MSEQILLVFEGRKTEPIIAKKLREHFFAQSNKAHPALIQASYGHCIYQLFQEVEADDGLELLTIVQEQLLKRKGRQEKISDEEQQLIELEDSSQFSDIFLFFDYDPHVSNFEEHKLERMLAHFDNSTEQGQLFISYPCVEAIRHIPPGPPQQVLYPIGREHFKNDKYKKLTQNPEYVDTQYHWHYCKQQQQWLDLVSHHLQRTNLLVNEQLTLPQQIIDQGKVLTNQQNKHLPSQQVAVIAAFPLMLHEYYGEKLLKKL